MTNKETTTIKVSVLPNHPNGQRTRGWFTFTEEPRTVEVNDEQLKAIKNDPVLKIYGKVTEVETPEAPEKTPEEIAAEEKAKKDAEETNKQPEAKPISRMNKEELIAWLVAKGLVADTDFDVDASNKDLAELLAAQA